MITESLNKLFSELNYNQRKFKQRLLGGMLGSYSKENERLKMILSDHDIDVLMVNKPNVTMVNVEFYRTSSYSQYALYKARQIASGMPAIVKTSIMTKFRKLKKPH